MPLLAQVRLLATSASAGLPVFAARSAATRPARSWVPFARVWSFPSLRSDPCAPRSSGLASPCPFASRPWVRVQLRLAGVVGWFPRGGVRPVRIAASVPSSPRRGVSGALGSPFGSPWPPCCPRRTGSAARFSLLPRCLAFRFGPPCGLVLRARAGHTLACGLRAFHGLPRRWLARTAAAVGVSLVAGPERRLPPVRHPGLGWAGEPWLSGAPPCVLRSVQEHAVSASRGSTRGIATRGPALRCDIVHVVRPVCRLLRAFARLPPTSPSLG